MKKNRRLRIRSIFHLLSVSALLLLVAFLVVLTFTVLHRRSVIARLEDRIELLKSETVPLRFMVLSRSDETVSARFRFYDADGVEIASFERSWNGSELSIDSVIVPVGERALVFPSRVFTDAVPPKRGTELFGYYDRGGFPAIFNSSALDKTARSALGELFGRVRTIERGDGGAEIERSPGDRSRAPSIVDRLLESAFGNAVHDLKRFRSFEVGAVYALVARANGGIEIIRE
jgi:hypothetical protein